MWHRTWFDTAARQTRRVSLGTADDDTAKAELVQWVTLASRPRNADAYTVNLGDLIARHVEHHAKGKRSEANIRRSLSLWNEAFPGFKVGELTPGLIEDFGKRLIAEGGFVSESVRRILSDGRAMLNRARKRGELAAVPFVPVGSFDEGEERQRVLAIEEIARLLVAIEQPWLHRFVMLALCTGARTEAILELAPFQVDLDKGLIRFNPPRAKAEQEAAPDGADRHCLAALSRAARRRSRRRAGREDRHGGLSRGLRARRARQGRGADHVPSHPPQHVRREEGTCGASSAHGSPVVSWTAPQSATSRGMWRAMLT